jgi:hypothetical protein
MYFSSSSGPNKNNTSASIVDVINGLRSSSLPPPTDSTQRPSASQVPLSQSGPGRRPGSTQPGSLSAWQNGQAPQQDPTVVPSRRNGPSPVTSLRQNPSPTAVQLLNNSFARNPASSLGQNGGLFTTAASGFISSEATPSIGGISTESSTSTRKSNASSTVSVTPSSRPTTTTSYSVSSLSSASRPYSTVPSTTAGRPPVAATSVRPSDADSDDDDLSYPADEDDDYYYTDDEDEDLPSTTQRVNSSAGPLPSVVQSQISSTANALSTVGTPQSVLPYSQVPPVMGGRNWRPWPYSAYSSSATGGTPPRRNGLPLTAYGYTGSTHRYGSVSSSPPHQSAISYSRYFSKSALALSLLKFLSKYFL